MSLTNSVGCDGVDRKEVMPCQPLHILRCFKPQHGLQLYIPKRSLPMGIHDATQNGVTSLVIWQVFVDIKYQFSHHTSTRRQEHEGWSGTKQTHWIEVSSNLDLATLLQYSIPTPMAIRVSLAHMLWVSLNKVQAKCHQHPHYVGNHRTYRIVLWTHISKMELKHGQKTEKHIELLPKESSQTVAYHCENTKKHFQSNSNPRTDLVPTCH